MKHIVLKHKTPITRKCDREGESIEEMLRRLTADKQPIPQNVPPIYTPDKEGVIPDYDIRADRFDVAMEARDKFSKSDLAKSAEAGETGKEGENDEAAQDN